LAGRREQGLFDETPVRVPELRRQCDAAGQDDVAMHDGALPRGHREPVDGLSPAPPDAVRAPLLIAPPTPDSNEFRMLEALVVEAVRVAFAAGQCAERFHGWRISVRVERPSPSWTTAGGPQATLDIYHHDTLWQHSTWRLDWPRGQRPAPQAATEEV